MIQDMFSLIHFSGIFHIFYLLTLFIDFIAIFFFCSIDLLFTSILFNYRNVPTNWAFILSFLGFDLCFTGNRLLA